jgi:uncharacterized protein involved in exopolysaccharide biosynthesis
MNHSASSPLAQFVSLLVRHPLRWLLPTIACTAAAVVFALLRWPTWEATQTLRLRPATSINADALVPGDDTQRMRAMQETVLELLHSRAVVEAVLKEVGPPVDRKAEAPWPTAREISDFSDSVRLAPPDGLEFGRSELLYLSARAADRARAKALCQSASERLIERYRQVRSEKADNLCVELDEVVALARADLEHTSQKLAEIEKQVGTDLGELRTLNETPGSDSALQRTATEIRSELRQARAAQNDNRRLVGVLEAAQRDPGRLLAAPAALLDSQPALGRLKEGLIDAQLNTATMKGRMSEAHPLVVAAAEAENEIGRHLHGEIGIALRAVRADLQLQDERIALLEEREQQAARRLARLAELRAQYGHLADETRHRTELLQRAQQQRAEARAMRAGAATGSPLWALDAPQTGPDPLGPGRTVIALAGLIGGSIVGLGILLLTTAPPARSTELVPVHLDGAEPSRGPFASAAVFAVGPAVWPGVGKGNGVHGANGSNGHAVRLNGHSGSHGVSGHASPMPSLKIALKKLARRRPEG